MLRDVQVKGHRARSYLKATPGVSVIDMQLLDFMPRIMGNADPMHYAQLLPGVQTNSEYDAGLHIQGCDNAHNQVSVNGIPLYNVSHMLGFFSVFNATHFSRMSLAKSPVGAASANRLGGMVDMQTADTVVSRLGGDVSVGPLSSQATLRLPLTRRSSLTLSAREAYINLFYSQWLKTDDEAVRYAFGDYNLSYLYQPTPRDTWRVDAYFGHDNVKQGDASYGYDAGMRWGNRMASLHWRHQFGGATFTQKIFYTAYQNRFRLDQTSVSLTLKSDIYDLGYRADLTAGRWKLGAALTRHSILPQCPDVWGSINSEYEDEPRQRAIESSLYASYQWAMGRRLTADLGVRATLYHRDASATYFHADPGLTLRLATAPDASLSLHAGLKHQNLFQTGFSQLGLPTEFWFSAGRYKPQYACHASVEYAAYWAEKTYRLSVETYYKRLFHQVEYDGNVFDFIYSSYDLDQTLLWGKGYNYGVNLLLEKRKGRLTGWVSYAYGRAMRRYPGTRYTGTYPASHERIHEFNAVATCRLGRRWSLGATFVGASGTPYTKVEQFFLMSHHLLAQYGPHNGSRVGMYGRLDLSASYDFRTRKGRRSGINLSLYNVTMRRNPLFYRLCITKNPPPRMGYRPFSFAVRLLPSVNYYYSF